MDNIPIGDQPEAAEVVVDAPVVLDPTTRQPKRKAWQKRTIKVGRVAGDLPPGSPMPPPASPKEAKAMVKQLAAEAVELVVTGKDIPKSTVEKHAQMSRMVKERIFSYLGDDVEKARREFAEELLANAREAAQHIMENFRDYPPSVQAFVFTAMADKSENLFNKSASSPQNAQVNVQINQFGDGTIDRAKIMKQLFGNQMGGEKTVEKTG